MSVGTKIIMGDPTLEARGLAMDFDVLRQKRIRERQRKGCETEIATMELGGGRHRDAS